MKVVNINGTSERDCACGNWLNHWKNFSNHDIPPWCAELHCAQPPEVGAHVQKDMIADKSWYIVPLCKEHNGKKGKPMILVDSVILVPANIEETCG